MVRRRSVRARVRGGVARSGDRGRDDRRDGADPLAREIGRSSASRSTGCSSRCRAERRGWSRARCSSCGDRSRRASRARMLKTLPETGPGAPRPPSPDAAVGATLAALRHGVRGTVDDYRAFGGDWGFDLGRRAACRSGAGRVTPTRSCRWRTPSASPRRSPTASCAWFPTPATSSSRSHAAEVFGALGGRRQRPRVRPRTSWCRRSGTSPPRRPRTPHSCRAGPPRAAGRRRCRCRRG